MKAVVFDFDGTLTQKSGNTWKSIWTMLGYPTDKESLFSKLYFAFSKGLITHQKWCDLTAEAFLEKGFNENMLTNVSKETILISGLKETLDCLKSNNISLHIVSGNIKNVMIRVLGDNSKYFDSINANSMDFDENGKINKIIGTTFDFEGKQKFIENLAISSKISTKEIVFVGNGDNDEWAHLSGCKTICINPDKTDGNNKKIWHHNIGVSNNLSDILSYMDFNESQM